MKKLASALVACGAAALSALTAQSALCQVAPATAVATAAVTFDVMEFAVEGNTLLPQALVETILQPYMGPGRSFKDMDAAREALEKAYQDAGYLSVVVSLPNQRVDAGEVRLDVTEAKVEKLSVTGAEYHLPSKVRGQMPSLQPGVVPYFPQVQQELAAVQSTDMQVTPLINPGSEADAIAVDLKVQDAAPVQASFELSNRQSYNTSKGRVSASASYGNLFQLGHRMGFSWQYAPWRPADGNTLTWLYSLPLSQRDDLTVSLTRSHSNTPIVTGDGGNTVTRGNQYSLRWQHDLPARNWPIRQSFYSSLDIKHNDDQTTLNETVNSVKPPLRYAVVGLGYNLNWTAKDDSQLGFNTSLSTSNHALSGRLVDCDGQQLDQFACKRSGAKPDFLTWRFGMEFKQPFANGWRMNLNAETQLASGPLAAGEQYTLGGKDSVRGYYDYEQSGDWGWTARAEVSSPPLFDLSGWRSLGLVFFDRGFVALIDPLEGQLRRANLASFGLGWRLENGKGLLLSLDVAQPIFETQRADNDGKYQLATHRSPRLLASIRQAF
jgi:hemolysin activation/secretion protein